MKDTVRFDTKSYVKHFLVRRKKVGEKKWVF